MSILSFEKPAKVVREGGFDGGPPGGYVPQMSKEDELRWKAKRFNAGKPNDRIEIRKTMGAQVLIIVAKDGWNYKNESDEFPAHTYDRATHRVGSKGLNVRISVNGPLSMTFSDWNQFEGAIAEARAIIEGVDTTAAS